MRILGFDVVVPTRFRVRTSEARDGRVCIDIEGEGADALGRSIERIALNGGFHIEQREAERVVLEREGQRLLLVHDDHGLTIQATDPALLECSKHEGSHIVLGDLRVDLGTLKIGPLREKRDIARRQLSASWVVGASTPATLVERVIDQAVTTRGLTRGASFQPPKNGIQCWTGEAHSIAELVKVRATLESDRVILEIVLIKSASHNDSGAT